METTPSATLPSNSARASQEFVSSLLNSDLFRDYQRAFQALTGLPLALRAVDSFATPMQGSKQGNPLCALMAGRNKTCAACLGAQQRLEQKACEAPATAQCFAGLHESAVPIRIGPRIVAFLQTGQVLFHSPTAAETRQAVRQAGALDTTLDRARFETAFRQSHVIPRSQYDAILRLLAIFAQQLSSTGNELMVRQSHAESPVIARARAFIAEHLADDLSLSDVSRAVGMSSFYFCKNFKKGTGMTFTEYLSRMRIETVKKLLLNPYKRISEAAYEAGFQSLSQFNRVFHRITGQSPSDYRDQLDGSLRLGASVRTQAHAA